MRPTPRSGLGLRQGYHSPQLDVAVRLNTNESPFPPPPEYQIKLAERLTSLALNRYPDRHYRRVREQLGAYLGVDGSRVFCANGSNEVLLNLCLGYGGPDREAVVFEPTYSLHSHISRTVGTNVISKIRNSEFHIEIDDETRGAISGADMVFLCTPNNPTGSIEPEAVRKEVINQAGGLVVVDEAYSDFSTPSRLVPREIGEQVVSVRTFSKWYSLAGLRFGYAIADEQCIAILDEVVLPYHFDQIKQEAVLVALEMAEVFDAQSMELAKLREDLVAGLRELGVIVSDSVTNFVLVQFPNHEPRDIWQALVERSIVVRDTNGWPHLPPSLRITVGTQSENDRLVEALGEILTLNG